MKPFEQSVGCRYGASLGRSGGRVDPDSKFALEVVDLDSGGYDLGGAYWGRGLPLYCATDSNGDSTYFRLDKPGGFEAAKTQFLRDNHGATVADPVVSSAMPEAFFEAYKTAALWSSTYEDSEGEGCPMDDCQHELAQETLDSMRADCESFWGLNYKHITESNYIGRAVGCSAAAYAGHDFWLTRCGHGAGFGDGDWEESADSALSKSARSFGNVDLYIGDDSLIYAT